MEKILQVLCTAIDSGRLVKIIFAGKRKKSIEYKKITLRPVTIKGEYMFQAEFHYDKKVTHENIPYYEAVSFAERTVAEDFKQVNILTESEDIQILASKPDRPKITRHAASRSAGERRKQYILEDGVPCDFLIELGVMSPEGKVFKKHYSKFRQINRYLEIADSCFEYLPDSGRLRIIDFGCGKSYLTFALYHYLRLVKQRDVEIIGLDLKKDVIDFCSRTARKLGYDELFSQIKSEVNEPMLKHGIIKDKFTELLTDGLRGLKLEAAGYEVAMTEFTSLEHTAKNIMIKAVMPDRPDRTAMKKADDEYRALKDFYDRHARHGQHRTIDRKRKDTQCISEKVWKTGSR